MSEIQDPEVKKLIEYANILRDEYVTKVKIEWEDSPFEWIAEGIPPRRKGTIAERLVEMYLTSKGFAVTKSPDTEADRIINGYRAEIKMSTCWEKGIYRFQQIRDQDYEFVICLGFSPFTAHLWVISKEELFHRLETGDIGPQHGGKKGKDTSWFGFDPKNVPSWINKWGGSLSEGVEMLDKLTKNNTP